MFLVYLSRPYLVHWGISVRGLRPHCFIEVYCASKGSPYQTTKSKGGSMFKEDRDESVFYWSMLGDIKIGILEKT